MTRNGELRVIKNIVFDIGGVLADFRIKPDWKMYVYFLEKFGLEPESCLFVDDTEENVTAARFLGFAGIVFRSYEELAGELKKAGVEIPE